MALTSVYYDGPVTETDRATSRSGAPDYGVYGVDDFKVSAHPSLPYALLVNAGKAHGFGVTDTAADNQTVQCATLSGAGAVRFDLIVARRNWQPASGGPSTLEAIAGGTTAPDINTVRTIGPGVEDDQPLALVEWRGDVNTPYRITDLRCWASNGGMIAVDTMALDYLAKPGADVFINGVTYRYQPIGNGAWAWMSQSPTTYGFVQPSGWSLAGQCRVTPAGALRRVDMDLRIMRTGANQDIKATFLDLVGVLSNMARGDSGDVKYVALAISGGSGNNGTIAMAYVNTTSGSIGFRGATVPEFTWTTGAKATINLTYYI